MGVMNYMEVVVENLLPAILESNPGVCNCEKCKADIKAIALNHLPPKYIVVQSGDVHSNIDILSIQFEDVVTNAILYAIKKLGALPVSEIEMNLLNKR